MYRKMKLSTLLFFIFIMNCSFSFNLENCIVTINQGNMVGKVRVNRKGGEFCSFTSIPYAKPPVADLRFMPPQPPESWIGVLNATIAPPSCYQQTQLDRVSFNGQEDCLYLNVFTKDYGITNLKPVMVYIHGGGYIEGSSNTDTFGPEYLLTEDIVLVTMNYRLNTLGFLSLEDESLGVTGNAALKDQNMALKWVNKNIKYFGGNPHLVTIFGESAGAGCVEYHTLSPSSQGLFHRAILQSGSVLNPWSNGIKGNGKIWAKQLGIQTENETEILAALKVLPLEELDLPYDGYIDRYRQNAPVVEGKVEGAFLTKEPRKLLQNGSFARVPTLIGYNSHEGLYKFVTNTKPPININFSQYVPNDLNPTNNPGLSEKISKEISDFYNSLRYNGDLLRMEVDVITDSTFLYGIYTTTKTRLAASKSPLYFYRFSMDTNLNLVKKYTPIAANITGAAHGEDIFYLFTTNVSPPVTNGSFEEECVEKLVKLWTNFAKYGNPTPPCLDDIEWPLATYDSIRYLEIGNTISVGKNPDANRVAFWEKLYEKYNDIL